MNWIKDHIAWDAEIPDQSDVNHFFTFPDSMKWGVFVEFFDQVGLNPYVEKFEGGCYDYVVINEKAAIRTDYNDGPFNTLAEAREAAFVKCQEIYLNQN